MTQGIKHEATAETKEQVERMKSSGLTNDEIAYIMDITEKTLVKHYEKQLEFGKAKVKALISGGIIKRAIDGDNACSFFYMKTQCGWHETQHIEQTVNMPDKLVDAPPRISRDEWFKHYGKEDEEVVQ